MRTEGRVLQEVHGNRGKAFDAPLLPAKLGGAGRDISKSYRPRLPKAQKTK